MNLYRNTVSELLWEVLNKLMNIDELGSFRLVGGTSLSLLLGHRKSVDIDLFTDVDYGSIDFEKIDSVLKANFLYVEPVFIGKTAMGTSYFVGNDNRELVKLDLFYTDKFVFPIIQSENIRLSCLEEIIAMKLEVVGNSGRKKDFWDLHELLDKFSPEQMFDFYFKRYPYSHTKDELTKKLIDFSEADNDFDPICFRNKYWELIKLDFEDLVKNF